MKRSVAASALGLSLFSVVGATGIEAYAQVRASFRIYQHYQGATSGTDCYEGLCISVTVDRLNVNDGKSNICANFVNQSWGVWTGGYRVTNRDVNTTFASMRIEGGGRVRRCEILPVTDYYYVALREDS